LSYLDLKPYFTNNIWDKVWFVWKEWDDKNN
jgi:hypothetical protein